MPGPPDQPAGGLDRTANVVGALALMLADRTADAVTAAAGHSATAATALSALHHFLDRPTVDTLRRVLGLTPSGAVRLLDRLAEAGYVERRPGADGRSISLQLTAAGREAAERVSAARAAVLTDALAVLSPAERQSLDRIASRVLVGLMRPPGATRWMCRLCDTGVCRAAPGDCPIRAEVRRRYPEAEGG